MFAFSKLKTQDDLPAISRNTVTKDVLNHVRHSILSGQLRGGERLLEMRLAEDLGVSRAPVREALRQLEQEGLIETLTHRGTFVREFTLEDIQELFLLRTAIEKLAAQLATNRASAGEKRQLEHLVEQMEAMDPAQPNLGLATQLDTAFHETLCRISHHGMLLKIWNGMHDQIRLAIHSANVSFPAFSGFAGGHRQVVQAIQAGDARQAADAIEQHIITGLNSLLATAASEDQAA